MTAPAETYADVAPWIRGRVRKVGRQWFVEVTNTTTGAVIVSDDCRDWSKTITEAYCLTGVARAVWLHGIRHRLVKHL